MANQFLANRQAFGTVYLNCTQSSNAVASFDVPGVFIPKGAIITDIKYVPSGALTGAGSLANATIQAAVGGQVIATNDAIASAALIAGSVYNHTVIGGGIGAGPILTAGGQLAMQIASSNSNRTAAKANVGVYVGYLMSN